MGYIESQHQVAFFLTLRIDVSRLTLPEEEAQRRKKQREQGVRNDSFLGQFIFSFFVLSSLS